MTFPQTQVALSMNPLATLCLWSPLLLLQGCRIGGTDLTAVKCVYP